MNFFTENQIYSAGRLVVLCTALVAWTAKASPHPDTNAPMAQKLTPGNFKTTQSIDINYLLFLPEHYNDKPGQRWPLIFFLHGAGERGTELSKVATHGPPKYVRDHPEFPFIVVAPQCPEGQVWSREKLLPLLEEVLNKYAVDRSRVYLTGLSMGGYGTWDLGLACPDKFAAIVPICGGGESITALISSRDKQHEFKTLGVWAFHGAKDPVVPVAESQRMVDICKKTGIEEVALTVYPEAQHDSWTQTYTNPDLYKWLLKHERKLESK